MDSIAAMPFGFLTGPNQLYGYDPKTGKLYALEEQVGTYNLAKAWSSVRVPRAAATWGKGPEVVKPIDNVSALSTNSIAQGCLEAIEVLEMCGDQMG